MIYLRLRPCGLFRFRNNRSIVIMTARFSVLFVLLLLLCWQDLIITADGLNSPNPTILATSSGTRSNLNPRYGTYWEEEEAKRLIQQEGGQELDDKNGTDLPSYVPASSSSSVEEDPTVASWRDRSVESWEEGGPSPPRWVDERGQRKLILAPTDRNQISKASLSIWFLVLLLRSLSHYEMAGLLLVSRTSKKTLLRTFLPKILLIPPALLLVGNILGFVLSITAATTHANKRMFKVLINMNQAMELFFTLYYFLRLTILPNTYVTKEIYVGKLFNCALYLISSHMFTRVSWDAAQQQQIQQRQIQQEVAPPSSPSDHNFDSYYNAYYTQEDDFDTSTQPFSSTSFN